MNIEWDEWRGSLDGIATMMIKRLLTAFGCAIDLHQFVGTDAPRCFHTHPAWAVRIILSGGYVEELESGELCAWLPGSVGIVAPSMSHRVHMMVGPGRTFTLWLRGPKIADVELRGHGWPPGSCPAK